MPSSTRWSRLAAALLGATWLFHAWRAATAALTTDEAFTALHFVAKPWLEVMTTFDANHHVLHTLLCKLSVGALGWSELALRLPALLGTAVLFVSLWRLLRRAVGETALLAAGCLLVAWWPELSDFLSLARGYSLALGFFTAGLIDAWDERYQRMSVLFGLAVASNLILAAPVTAAVIALTVARGLWRRFDELAGPGAVVSFVVVSLPLSRATAANFYFGAAGWRNSLETMLHVPGPEWWSGTAIFAVPAAMLWAAWRQRDWLAGTFVLSVAAVIGPHLLLATPWPSGRTGLHLVLLGLVLVVSAARAWRWSAALLALAGLWCAANVDPRGYREWMFDSEQREVLAAIVAYNPKAQVMCTSPLDTALEYYMKVRQVQAPPPVAYRAEGLADVYVLQESVDRPPRGARLLARFAKSGVALYAR